MTKTEGEKTEESQEKSNTKSWFPEKTSKSEKPLAKLSGPSEEEETDSQSEGSCSPGRLLLEAKKPSGRWGLHNAASARESPHRPPHMVPTASLCDADLPTMKSLTPYFQLT